MAGMGRLLSGAGAGRSQDSVVQDSQKIVVELERRGAEGQDPEAYSENWLQGLVPGGGLTPFFSVECTHRIPVRPRPPGSAPRPFIICLRHYADRDVILRTVRAASPPRVDGAQILLVPDYTLAVQRDRASYLPVKCKLKSLGLNYSLLFPAKLCFMAENKSHFFATPEAAWEWLESMGLVLCGAAERTVPVPRGKHSRARRVLRRGEVHTGPVTHAPDLEQLIQERREVIHSVAAFSASPLASESDTELSQLPNGRPATPDCLSELGLVGGHQ
ncbi:hypothetical protein NDU88_003875 [Pleurodeles waltl]|uniref:Uncharacterized protein n=1 Tax=Pleurodeles waltl TaxID=8319 RepID=A0AAV7LGZ7_PLEWA|nr:hypothetical protein NDU88_003875 [Pleurodeles waltl]